MLTAHLVKIRNNLKSFAYIFGILLSQIKDEFPICSIVTRCFNACCTNWWKDITNSTVIDSLMSSAGYTQIIVYIITCIDLIFCNNQNVVSKYGVVLPFLTNVITISFMA